MKKLNKRVLDELIEVERNYWGMGLNDKELDRQARKAIDTAMDLECGWSCAVNLTTSIIGGFNRDASNEDIYNILKILGWEVTDEEVEESESV